MDLAGKIITCYYDIRAKLAPRFRWRRVVEQLESRELTENGVLVLRRLIPESVVDKINKMNDPYFEFSKPSELLFSPDGKELLETEGSSLDEAKHFYFLHIKNYHLKFNVYDEIVPFIAPILSAYYKSAYYVRDLACYRTQPIPKVQGSYQWHVDNYPAGSLKTMVYLTDVTEEQGPLKVALKSHIGFRPSLGKVGDRYEAGTVTTGFETFACTGEKGTVIIFNNNTIHRAVDPIKGIRDVVNFTIFPTFFEKFRRPVRGLDLKTEEGFLKKYTR